MKSELADFVHWLTLTHTQRWHAHYRDVGAGHLYQGRYKSFPVAEDDHYFTVCRYVERNALRAGLVERAEAWRWGSLARRRGAAEGPPLSEGPLAWPANWLRLVNRPQTEADLAALRRSVQRGQPFGSEGWVRATAAKLHLESTLTARGRPKKEPEEDGKGSFGRGDCRLAGGTAVGGVGDVTGPFSLTESPAAGLLHWPCSRAGTCSLAQILATLRTDSGRRSSAHSHRRHIGGAS